MNETGKRSGKLSRQVAGLQSATVKLCGWRKDNENVALVSLELTAMVMSLNATEYDDYDPKAVLDYLKLQRAIEEDDEDRLLREYDFYFKFNRKRIIDEAVERILYVFLNGKNAGFGFKCPEIELTSDSSSNEDQKGWQIRNTLPQFISSIMGYRQDSLGVGGSGCEYEDTEDEEDVNIELTEEEMAEPEFENVETLEGPDEPEMELPMRFHWFWSHIALPVSAVSSAIYIILGILQISSEGMIMIVDILLNAGWFVFGIPALKGLLKYTSDGFDANNKLLIYLIGVRGVCALILAFLTGVAGMAMYLPDLIWAGCGIGIKKYYEKRKDYFNRK